MSHVCRARSGHKVIASRHNHSIAVIGCGYVGSALGEALVRAGHDVAGTTTTPARTQELQQLGIRPYVLRVADHKALHTMLTDREVVYLTVAPTHPSKDYRDVYLVAARNLVDALHGTSVTRIIYTSSTRVYDESDGGWVNEDSSTDTVGPATQRTVEVPPRPTDVRALPARKSCTDQIDEQAWVLLEAERILLEGVRSHPCEAPPNSDKMGDELGEADTSGPGRESGRVTTTTVVRLSGIYGPGRDPLARIRGLSGTQRDDGDAYVNMIHRDDIVGALVSLLGVEHHGVLNLSDDGPITRRDYYDRVLNQAGLPLVDWKTCGMSSPRGKRVQNERIKRLLNLTLKHPTH